MKSLYLFVLSVIPFQQSLRWVSMILKLQAPDFIYFHLMKKTCHVPGQLHDATSLISSRLVTSLYLKLIIKMILQSFSSFIQSFTIQYNQMSTLRLHLI